MAIALAELARLVDGRLLTGNSRLISGANTLNAAGPGDITLLDSPDKAHLLARSKAGAVVVPQGFEALDRPAIQAVDVHQAFAKIVTHFRPLRSADAGGVSPQAIVAASAQIAAGVEIHPGATIGADVEIGAESIIHSGAHVMAGCRIGPGVTIFPGAVLYENTIVGARSMIHSGAIVGAYGFGYKLIDGRHVLSSQLGYVELESDVEVGAGSTIDRGTYGATLIGEGTKIDNLVMIAHNCRIGKHNLICSQVGVAGSTSTGDYVVMAGQVGVRDHVHIGTGAVLGAKAGVSGDVHDGVHMLGTPAVPEREQKLIFATISKLPEMRRQLKELQRQMDELQGALPRNRRSHARSGLSKKADGRMQKAERDRMNDAAGPVGLIAGWGDLPILVAEALKRQGRRVCCVALNDHADPRLEQICDETQWTGVAKVGHAIRILKRHGVREATMAGKVFKVRLFERGAWKKFWPDWRAVRIFWSHFVTMKQDRKDDTLLLAIVRTFDEDGITLQPATDFAPELLVKFGQLTRLKPSANQLKDVEFGWQLAKEMGRLDVGQSVAVKGRACLAVEAIEGTDECIRRAGQLCPTGGFTVVKLAKPQQDMRFDVPTIGVKTLESMVAAGGKMLAVEADRTILVREREFIEFADRHQLIVIALDQAASAHRLLDDAAA